jgi:hypothetical protein
MSAAAMATTTILDPKATTMIQKHNKRNRKLEATVVVANNSDPVNPQTGSSTWRKQLRHLLFIKEKSTNQGTTTTATAPESIRMLDRTANGGKNIEAEQKLVDQDKRLSSGEDTASITASAPPPRPPRRAILRTQIEEQVLNIEYHLQKGFLHGLAFKYKGGII